MPPNQQSLLRIHLPPGHRVYPSTFREMLAKVPDLPNSLFHRDDNNETLNSRPGVRVVGARTWVGLLANPGYDRVVRDAVGPAIIAVSNHTGIACKVEMEQLEFGLVARDEPTVYWIREMAIKRRGPRALNMDLESLIAERVLTSIEAACSSADFECPTKEQLDIRTVEVVRSRGMQLQTTSGVTKEFVQLVDARVMIHAKLNGMWFAGNLTSRGYGRIILPRPGMDFGPEREGSVLQ